MDNNLKNSTKKLGNDIDIDVINSGKSLTMKQIKELKDKAVNKVNKIVYKDDSL